MNIIQGISSLLIGYLFGCFQTSYFISRLVLKKDIREMGSGNAGASNITSELGWKYGFLTGVADVFKAYIPAQLVLYIFPGALQQNNIMALAGTGAVLGHIYPFFLNFRGGKGVACYIGMLLAINWQIGIAFIIGLILITIITDYISVGDENVMDYDGCRVQGNNCLDPPICQGDGYCPEIAMTSYIIIWY